MSGHSLIIDTNIALYLLDGDKTLYYVLDGKTVYLSFVSELELLSYPGLTKSEELLVNQFIEDCIVIDANREIKNREIKNRTINLRRKYHLKLPDAIIAATADYLKQPLLTADYDFKKVDAINLLFYEK